VSKSLPSLRKEILGMMNLTFHDKRKFYDSN
jgi:hypothetical protein